MTSPPFILPPRKKPLPVGLYADRDTFAGAVKVIAVAPDGRRVMEAFIDERLFHLLEEAGNFERAGRLLHELGPDTRRPSGPFSLQLVSD